MKTRAKAKRKGAKAAYRTGERGQLGSAADFDRDYYRRYYFDPRTAVTTRAEMDARGRLIAGLVDHIDLPVRNILDVGCGVGLLRRPLLKALPQASYSGMEYSEYLCRRYGWQQGAVQDLRTRSRYELVICYDVVQYLDNGEAARAIANLARVCRGVLYFGALTSEDWSRNCDQSRTDQQVKLRPGRWYRRELARGFHQIGAGFWLRRSSLAPRGPLYLWELDSAGQVT
jgi:SAM-dependent methyltransferase